MNEALLGKWIWKFFNEPDLIWVRMIKSQYYVNKNVREVNELSQGVSVFWKGIVTSLELILRHSKVIIGTGKETSFWHDIWHGEVTLKERYPSLFELSGNKNGLVSELINMDVREFQFRRNLTVELVNHLKIFMQEMLSITLTNNLDVRRWQLNANGRYTVKSGYNSFFSNLPNCPFS